MSTVVKKSCPIHAVKFQIQKCLEKLECLIGGCSIAHRCKKTWIISLCCGIDVKMELKDTSLEITSEQLYQHILQKENLKPMFENILLRLFGSKTLETSLVISRDVKLSIQQEQQQQQLNTTTMEMESQSSLSPSSNIEQQKQENISNEIPENSLFSYKKEEEEKNVSETTTSISTPLNNEQQKLQSKSIKVSISDKNNNEDENKKEEEEKIVSETKISASSSKKKQQTQKPKSKSIQIPDEKIDNSTLENKKKEDGDFMENEGEDETSSEKTSTTTSNDEKSTSKKKSQTIKKRNNKSKKSTSSNSEDAKTSFKAHQQEKQLKQTQPPTTTQPQNEFYTSTTFLVPITLQITSSTPYEKNCIPLSAAGIQRIPFRLGAPTSSTLINNSLTDILEGSGRIETEEELSKTDTLPKTLKEFEEQFGTNANAIIDQRQGKFTNEKEAILSIAKDREKQKTSRQYQVEIARRAIERNTIVYLETGSGKTFIATMVIKELSSQLIASENKPRKWTIFLVNSVLLAFQQAAVIAAHCPSTVNFYCGRLDVDNWSKHKWESEFEENQIMIMTAQIFLDLMRHGFFSLKQCNLLIFDECHHARAQHPYVSIMQEFYHSTPVSERPRFLGLTASVVFSLTENATEENCQNELKSLEKILDSKIYSPFNREELERLVPKPFEQIINYIPNVIDFDLAKYVETTADRKTLGDIYNSYENLGSVGAKLFIDLNIQKWQQMSSTMEAWLIAQQMREQQLLRVRHQTIVRTQQLNVTSTSEIILTDLSKKEKPPSKNSKKKKRQQQKEKEKETQQQQDSENSSQTNDLESANTSDTNSTTTTSSSSTTSTTHPTPTATPQNEPNSLLSNPTPNKQFQVLHKSRRYYFDGGENEQIDEEEQWSCSWQSQVRFFSEGFVTAASALFCDNKNDSWISAKYQLLVNALMEYKGQPNFSGIVLVERRSAARVLAELLSRTPELSWLKCGSLTGHGTQKDMLVKSQKNVMDSFREGLFNLIVATDVAEEGLDIQPCKLVVRFDQFKTLKSYIQSRGRARHPESKYLILLPVGSIEHEKARFHEQLIRKTIWASPTILDDTKTGMKEEVDYSLSSANNGNETKKESIPNIEKLKNEQQENSTPSTKFEKQEESSTSRLPIKSLQETENPFDNVTEPVKMKFFEVPKTGARVTLNSSTAILQQYCNRLPHDAYSTADPVFWRQLDDGLFRMCLPASSPLRTVMVSNVSGWTLARNDLATQAVKLLWECGELDDHLYPVSLQYQHIPNSEKGKQIAANAATKKKLRISLLHHAPYMFQFHNWSFDEKEMTTAYGTVLEFTPIYTDAPEDQISESYKQNFKKLKSTTSYLWLGPQPLYQGMPPVTMFFGEIEVELTSRPAKFSQSNNSENLKNDSSSTSVKISKSQFIELMAFQKKLMIPLLSKLTSKHEKVDPFSNNNSYPERPELDGESYIYFIAPLLLPPKAQTKSQPPQSLFDQIDWNRVNEIQQKKASHPETAIFTRKGDTQLYHFHRWDSKTARSQFPTTKHGQLSFGEYYQQRYNLEISNWDQKLIQVSKVSRKIMMPPVDTNIEEDDAAFPTNVSITMPEISTPPTSENKTEKTQTETQIETTITTPKKEENDEKQSVYFPVDVLEMIGMDYETLDHARGIPYALFKLEKWTLLHEFIHHQLKLDWIPIWKVLEALSPRNTNNMIDYERRETHGDSILKFVITWYLFVKYPMQNESFLSSRRASMVKNSTLSLAARNRLEIERYIQFGQFEKWVPCSLLTRCGVILPDSSSDEKEDKILADMVEALVSCCFELKGWDGVIQFIQVLYGPEHNFEILRNNPNVPMPTTAPIVSLPILPKGSGLENNSGTPLLVHKSIEYTTEYAVLEKELNYVFKNKLLLLEALTHQSETTSLTTSYQRLEFFGDAILETVVTNYLFKFFPDDSPSNLHLCRASLVCSESLLAAAVRLNLHKWLRHGSHALFRFLDRLERMLKEKQQIEIAQSKVVSDLIESLAGAVFVDSGMQFEVVEKFIVGIFNDQFTRFHNKKQSQRIPGGPLQDMTHLVDGGVIQLRFLTIEQQIICGAAYFQGEKKVETTQKSQRDCKAVLVASMCNIFNKEGIDFREMARKRQIQRQQMREERWNNRKRDKGGKNRKRNKKKDQTQPSEPEQFISHTIPTPQLKTEVNEDKNGIAKLNEKAVENGNTMETTRKKENNEPLITQTTPSPKPNIATENANNTNITTTSTTQQTNLELIKSCVICGKESTNRCGGCKVIYYCSTEHQRKHWSSHKLTCKKI